MNTRLSPLMLLPVPLMAANTEGPDEGNRRLNIVYIMTDDHSYQTISAYGGILAQYAPTPNLDRLAAQGTLFERAFVENSLSSPSRACLMTGLYSHQNGQRYLFGEIDSTKTFISEVLQDNGYQTAMIGKWHLNCTPKGFDYYQVLNGQGEYYHPGFKSKESAGQYVQKEGYATRLITDYAIDFLEHRKKEAPFCLFVHHKAPHRNWQPEQQYLDLFNDVEFPYPETFNDDYANRTPPAHEQEMQIDRHMKLIYDLKLQQLIDSIPFGQEPHAQEIKWILNRMTPEERDLWCRHYDRRYQDFISKERNSDELKKWKYQAYMRDYLRCIRSVDDEVGRLIDYLEEKGMMDNTVIVYASDQGFYMGEHGWFDKRFMYEESFRTPLIIYYPTDKGEKRGQRNKELVQNIDFAPTILDIAGVEKPDYMSGRSIVPLLTGTTPKDWRKDLYYHYYDHPAEHQVWRHDGVRDKRYKLIHYYNEKNRAETYNELYDLKADPNELNNLYGHAKYKKVQRHLEKRLSDYRRELKIDEY